MAEFRASKGFKNCTKCGGWQVLDYTKRKPDKTPIGALDYRDCDRCLGKGEIPDETLPVVAVEPPKRERKPRIVVDLPVNDIGDWSQPKLNPWADIGVAKPVEPINPWANLKKD